MPAAEHILRSGLRHFSAGADVTQFSARIEQGGRSQSPIGGVEFLKLLELLPIAIVASLHGVCLGGGFELALACDYIVAASSAKIGSVEVALGLHPLLSGIQRQVQRAGAMRAKEISMLGRNLAFNRRHQRARRLVRAPLPPRHRDSIQ
jgi:enoyl-CoA hydratase/carnithine racemase